jgi:2-polyprenyl-3-methyl-5-hydroxy-6-metoxy-1,4-benzoquinol methylase
MNPELETTVCEICGSARSKNILLAQDLFYYVTKQRFTYVKCLSCGHIFLNPRPTRERIGEYYTKTYPVFADSDANESISIHRQRSWPRRLIRKMLGYLSTTGESLDDFVLNNPRLESTKLKLLDVGCANGAFLEKARLSGYSCFGLEPNTSAVIVGRSKGYDIREGTPESVELEEGAYDVIRLNHVFEHVHNPVSSIKALSKALKPAGHLVMVVPNGRSIFRYMFSKYWFSLQPPIHLHQYTLTDFEQLSRIAGLRIQQSHFSLSPSALFASAVLLFNYGILKKQKACTAAVEKSLGFGKLYTLLLFSPVMILFAFLGMGNALSIVMEKE